jgi:hypothetical protein
MPGPILIALTALVLVVGIIGSTGPDLDFLMWGSILAGLTIGGVWLLTLIIVSADTRLRFDRKTWARWLTPPSIFFVGIMIMASGFPASARFEASRTALEQAAARAQAGDHFDAGWIGLVQVYDVQVDGTKTLFQISTSDYSSKCSLAYAGTDYAAMSAWVSTAWNVKSYGHGWWYGCQGQNWSD